MCTPLDLLLDPISLAVFGIYAELILWEVVAGIGRRLLRHRPSPRGLDLRGAGDSRRHALAAGGMTSMRCWT
jgi:hypothetical protein